MRSDERRRGMARNQILQSLHQRIKPGKFGSVKTPFRRALEFIESLIPLIDWFEEGNRIPDMDENRNVQLACFCPQRIQSRRVDGKQFSRTILHSQSKVFPDF